MELWIWAFLAGGLALLAVGGDLVVRGSVGVARSFSVPAVVIGIVLVGFGTSLPELVTSLTSALQDSPGLAVGNVVGSNIANLFLIAGLAAALSGCATSRALVTRDGAVMAGMTIALAALLFTGGISGVAGAVLLAVLAVYLIAAMSGATAGADAAPAENSDASWPAIVYFGLFAVGLIATLIGADLLVDGAKALARALGAPDALIGVTIVAVGTSLPELSATIAAAVRGRAELAIGNVFGSNIFNVGAIVGITALATPLEAPAEIVAFDMWAMLAATAIVLALAWTARRLSRLEGGVLLGLYVVYLGLTVWMSGALG